MLCQAARLTAKSTTRFYLPSILKLQDLTRSQPSADWLERRHKGHAIPPNSARSVLNAKPLLNADRNHVLKSAHRVCAQSIRNHCGKHSVLEAPFFPNLQLRQSVSRTRFQSFVQCPVAIVIHASSALEHTVLRPARQSNGNNSSVEFAQIRAITDCGRERLPALECRQCPQQTARACRAELSHRYRQL